MNFDARLLRYLDKLLMLATLGLIVFGIIAVSSAAVGYVGADGASRLVKQQIIAAVIGMLAIAFVLLFDYTDFSRMAKVLYGLNVFLLVLVLIIGVEVNEVKAWIDLGFTRFQPAELSKILLILTLGHQLSETEHMDSLWDLVPVALHVLPLLVLVMLQPDLGTGLVFVAIAAAMVYMAGFPGWKIALMVGIPTGGIAAWVFAHLKWGVSMALLPSHVVTRLLTFANPMEYMSDDGYQVVQSFVAIGSGGLTGQGLHQGSQTQLGFLPEQHTDFIFAAICEELGFVGGALLIGLFLLLLWRMATTAATAKDQYGTLIVTGVIGMIGFHAVQNIGMNLGVLPVTGIPLPFISYGGTAMMTNLIAVGLVLNVGMRRQKILF